jgi:chemotaxis protein CheD
MTSGVCAWEPRDCATAVIGVGELYVTADPAAVLVTYALGSCLAVAVHDPAARVGGMLHAMLPRSDMDPARARAQPALFVDTGIPALFRACYALGARKERIVVSIAGAAAIHGPAVDQFQIGKRNLLMARQLFWRNRVMVHGQDVGGIAWRNMRLDMRSGEVLVHGSGTALHLNGSSGA